MGVSPHPQPLEDAVVIQSSNPAPTPTIPLSLQQIQALAPFFPLLGQFADSLGTFLDTPPSPTTTAAFEQQLAGLTNQLGLAFMDHALNSIEPDDRELLPDEIRSHGTRYRLRSPVNW